MEPVLGLAGVALTATVSLITTWRWPTLSRRLRDHAELVKLMPQGHGDVLLTLLDQEVQEYAEREHRRLNDPHAAVRAWTLRIGATGTATALTAAVVAPIAIPDAPGAATWAIWMLLILFVLITAGAAVASLLRLVVPRLAYDWPVEDATASERPSRTGRTGAERRPPPPPGTSASA